MAGLIERIRRRYDRFAAGLQAALDWLYLINVVDQTLREWKLSLIVGLAALSLMAWLTLATWATTAEYYLSNFKWIATGIVATIASLLLLARKATKAPAPTRRINEAFYQRILQLSREAYFRPALAASEQDIMQIAKLEHEAFFAPSLKTLRERYERVREWLQQMDGLGQFIEVDEEILGYSVIIPVSEDQAKIFQRGYATEWAFQVKRPDPDQPRLTLYAQATFVKHRHQRSDSTLGLAQAAVLQHLLDLTKCLSKFVLKDDSPEAVRKLLERTRVLADKGSPRGGKFMRHLGFLPRKKTANRRTIWELDLSVPAAPGTSLYQSRRLIAERLGVADSQKLASPGWKERWESLSSKMFGYTE